VPPSAVAIELVIAGRDVILASSRAPQFPAKEVGDRVNRLLRDYAGPFVGRQKEFDALDRFRAENHSGLLLLTAQAGFGKSSLLAQWLTTRRNDTDFIAYHFFSQRHETASVADAYLNLLRQLCQYYGLGEDLPPREEHSLRDTLYSLLTEKPLRPDYPLVVLLDALDEAEHSFSPPLILPPRDGLFVIASARANRTEEPQPIRSWLSGAIRHHLERLSLEDLANWLRQAGNGELASFAADPNFVTRLDSITAGYPLYIHYLFQELQQAAREAKDVWQCLLQTPHGFESYVKEQVEHLDSLNLPEERWKFFALLTVVLGPISQEEVKQVTDLRDRDLRQMQQVWQVMRWLQLGERPQGITYAFAQPLLAETFGKILGDDANEVLKDLLRWCACWPEHHSPYALRYYAEHLLAAIQERQIEQLLPALYGLARDQGSTGYLSRQAEQFPEYPDLPFRTIRLALAGAAQADDVEALCEFLLLHAWRLERGVPASPLEAAARGDRERAWGLADLRGPAYSSLWQLLVAWEFSGQGRTEDAKATLHRVQKASLAVPSELKPLAFYLVGECSPVDAEVCQALLKGLVEAHNDGDLWSGFWALAPLGAAAQVLWLMELGEEWHLAEACQHIAGQFALLGETGRDGLRGLAHLLLKSVHKNHFRVDALMSVAKAQERAGDPEAALESGRAALETARALTDERDRSVCFRAIARIPIEVKDRKRWEPLLAEMQSLARKLGDRKSRMLALAAVAAALALAGERDLPEKAFVQPRDLALGEEAAEERAGALAQVAVEWSLAGNREAASRGFNEALDLARHIADEWLRSIAVDKITNFLIQAGDLAQARQVAQTLDTRDNSEILLKIAQQEALRGNVSATREIALGLRHRSRRAQALAMLAQAQVRTGENQAAQETFAAAAEASAGIEDEDEHWSALGVIIRAQVAVGETASALRNARHITRLKPRADALLAVAEATAQAGDAKTARSMLAEALDATRGTEQWQACEEALNALAAVQHEAKDRAGAMATWAKAQEAARRIKQKQDRSAALAEVAVALAKAGEWATAAETARVIEDPTRRVTALCQIAVEQTTAGQQAIAAATLAAALDSAYLLQDVAQRENMLADIAVAQARVSTWVDALSTARTIEEADIQQKALAPIVLAQAAAQAFPQALQTAQRIKNGKDRVRILTQIAVAQAQSGATQEARETFASAMAATTSFDATIGRVRVTIGRQEYNPYDERAAEDFEARLPDVVKEGLKKQQQAALAFIARAQAQLEDWAAALETARSIEDPAYRAVALGSIAALQAAAGRTAMAIETFACARDTARHIDIDAARKSWLRDEMQYDEVLAEIAAASTEAREWATALETARDIEDPARRVTALCQIAVQQTTDGQQVIAAATLAAALDSAHLLQDVAQRENMLADIAVAQAEAGLVEQAGLIAQSLTASRNRHWARIGAALLSAASNGPPQQATDAKEQLKQLAAISVYDLGLAYRMCGLLSRLYPSHAARLAELVAQFNLTNVATLISRA
jgi:hypothetical protein